MSSLSPVWQSCLEHFLQQVSRSHSAATQKAYRSCLQRFFASLPTSPELCTLEDVYNFIYAPSDKSWTRDPEGTVKTATTNFRQACIRSFYSFASVYTVPGSEGEPVALYQRPNPTTGIHPQKPARAYKAFSEEELRKLFACIDTSTVRGLRDKALLLCYWWTCRRREEIARLRWGDLEQTIILDENGATRLAWVYRYFGKGHSQEQSSAELPQPAVDALMRYLEASGRLQTMQPDSPLFVAIGPDHGLKFDSTRQLSGSQINRLLKSYLEKAGLDTARFSIHSLRHTAARMRHAHGSSILDIQAVLGHVNLNTTFIYLQALSPVSDPGARLLENQFAQL